MQGFVDTAAGPVPGVATRLSPRDRFGSLRARMGIVRNRYRVNPGLYCVGEPGTDSPVLLTADYKLSFDTLRRNLAGIDAFILVVDTRGINVWCAAGKGTFSADEVALQVERTRLAERVEHRELILPQLAAPGVAAHTLKKKCGFSAIFGPIRAADIPLFLANGKRCDESMRSLTFTLAERTLLTPVEVTLALKPLLLVTLVLLFLAGVGPGLFSLARAMERGPAVVVATVSGLLVGAVLTPMLLPLVPGRQFWLKGIETAMAVAAVFFYFRGFMADDTGPVLWFIALSSYLAMNFTGATPFTSLSGVKKELPRGLAVEIILAVLAISIWLAGPFMRG